MPAEEGVSQEVVVVVGGGPAPVRESPTAVPPGAFVIAADRGVEHALTLGLEVSLVVGDLDSADPDAVRNAERAGARIERHPVAKDATDLELALDAALRPSPARILVLAGDGGRLDHLLAGLLLLGAEKYAPVEIEAWVGPARVRVVRRESVLTSEPGELVSLLALGGAARGVATHGLVYPLAGETLEPGSSRGLSNVFADTTARVTVEEGVLLAVQPGHEEEIGR
jgi:thiamine pyrophosphokinase